MINKFEKLKDKIFKRIQNIPCNVILRREINSIGSPSQISRCIRVLIEAKELVKIGHGIYAKSYISQYSSKPLIKGGADNAWLEALTKLGVKSSSIQRRNINASACSHDSAFKQPL